MCDFEMLRQFQLESKNVYAEFAIYDFSRESRIYYSVFFGNAIRLSKEPENKVPNCYAFKLQSLMFGESVSRYMRSVVRTQCKVDAIAGGFRVKTSDFGSTFPRESAAKKTQRLEVFSFESEFKPLTTAVSLTRSPTMYPLCLPPILPLEERHVRDKYVSARTWDFLARRLRDVRFVLFRSSSRTSELLFEDYAQLRSEINQICTCTM